jgi:hypothetical protein
MRYGRDRRLGVNVPAAEPATIAAMADDFERRFRQQHAEVFRTGGTPQVWLALAVAYLRFSDENSNPRSLDQQLLNVLNRARRDGVFVPWHYVLADAAVSGTVLRAYDLANRDEAAAAAREGRKPTRPPYRWSEESRTAKRKPRDA